MNAPHDQSNNEIFQKMTVDGLAEQGIQVTPGSPTKNAQVAKELAEEAKWPAHSDQHTDGGSKSTPDSAASKQAEDNDYYNDNGLSQ